MRESIEREYFAKAWENIERACSKETIFLHDSDFSVTDPKRNPSFSMNPNDCLNPDN